MDSPGFIVAGACFYEAVSSTSSFLLRSGEKRRTFKSCAFRQYSEECNLEGKFAGVGRRRGISFLFKADLTHKQRFTTLW